MNAPPEKSPATIPSTLDADGNLAIHRAVAKNDLEELRQLIADGADVNASTKDGRTPLGMARKTYHLDAARMLVKAGASKHDNETVNYRFQTSRICSPINRLSRFAIVPAAVAAYVAGVDCKDITREQAETMGKVIVRQLRYLGKLRTRMEKTGFPPNDPLYREVSEAYNKIHSVRVTLHYLACDPRQIGR